MIIAKIAQPKTVVPNPIPEALAPPRPAPKDPALQLIVLYSSIFCFLSSLFNHLRIRS